MKPTPAPSSALATTSASSTASWQTDLKTLFDHTKERFPDVVWELSQDEGGLEEEVWGHKAMVYARAPPSFLEQYFDVRPNPNGNSRIFSSSPAPGVNANAQSTFSLGLPEDQSDSRTPTPSQTPHPYSPSLSSPPTNPLLRLTTTISPSLFSNQLEYLYTGKGIGASFVSLFDSTEEDEDPGDLEANRVDKLSKDLVFMWRSRLYSDVRISLTGPFSPDSEEATAVFSSHRFILASRSPYFRSLFLSKSFAPIASANTSSPITISLPSPPFTPASLHFTLGYIYSGTLFFSHRTFDLETSFHIYRSAAYLSIGTLQSEIEARIVEEMMHGLFHAYLSFEEYEKVTGGRWGVGGCKCKTCTRRAPRILEFATSDDVKNTILDRGSRRALVGMFGEGWVTPEFANLPVKYRAAALKGVYARSTPQNLIPLLYASEAALVKLEAPGNNGQPWTEIIRDLILQARKKIDDVMCVRCEDVFEQEEWLAILERDGVSFDDGDKVRWVMDSLLRGLEDATAGMAYQTLVSSVLLRPHPTPASPHASTLLSSTSPVRSQVERARLDIIRWLRKRWVGVRFANGFDNLDGWALKEISDELDVPVDELIASNASPQKGPPTRHSGDTSVSSKPNQDADTGSITSLRASVLNRNAARTTVQEAGGRESLASSRSSVSSVSTVQSRNTLSPGSVRSSVASTIRTLEQRGEPSNASPSPRTSSPRTRPENGSRKPLIEGALGLTTSPSRPKSIAPSVASARPSANSVRSAAPSTTSTLRKARAAAPPALRKVVVPGPSPLSRPQSSGSVASEASTSFGAPQPPASSGGLKGRVAPASARQPSPYGGLTVPINSRQRKTSTTSNTSVASSAAGSTKATPLSRKTPVATEKSKVGPRPSSVASVRSNVSTASTVAGRKGANGKVPLKQQTQPAPPVPDLPTPKLVPKPVKSSGSLKSKSSSRSKDKETTPAETSPVPPALTHALEPSNASTVRAVPIVERKASTDTITKSPVPPASVVSVVSTTTPRTSMFVTPRESMDVRITTAPPLKKAASSSSPLSTTSSLAPPVPPKQAVPVMSYPARGVTLNIGIPCMISSKRSRFKAFARYIGEVQGEDGPWVGVEVPVGEGWGADKLDGRDWNDGSVGGVRYFEIGSSSGATAGSTTISEDDDERASRRRRLNHLTDSIASSIASGPGSIANSLNRRKREGDQLLVEQDRLKRLRSVSPAVSDASSAESRGLFVRPQQILLVIDAQEQG